VHGRTLCVHDPTLFQVVASTKSSPLEGRSRELRTALGG
jgi:hypothetical protein